MSEYIPLVGSLSYRQPLSISFFRMHHVSAEGVGWGGGRAEVTMVREPME